MKSRFSFLAAALTASFGLANAGTTGKIAGTVTDSQTGEPLVGVGVVIEGTTQGSATNLDGYYVILNIVPGRYTLVASGVGYNKMTVENVSVSIDLTTTQDFKLTSTVVAMNEEVVVTASRPLVQKDLTATTAIVNGDQIASLPVAEIGQVLNLQAGITNDNTGGIHLRGGRSGEVAYWIDGVPVTDGYDGAQVVEVNKSMVQQLQLVSGAYNAEYGEAMSGIVNIATKEGGAKYTGSLTTYAGTHAPSGSSDLYPGFDRVRPTSIRDYEGSLSGPVLGENLTFFVNGRYLHDDGYLYGFNRFNPQNIATADSAGVFRLYRDPAGVGDSSAVSMNSLQRWYGQGKLTWRASSSIKVTGNYIYDYTEARPYNGFHTDYRKYLFDPNGMGNDYTTSNTVVVQLSHMLNTNTFYTLGGSVFVKKFKHYLYDNPSDPRYVHPKLETQLDPWSFYTGGTDLYHEKHWTATYLAKLDVTSQVDERNLVKVGVMYTNNRVYYDSYTLQPVQSQADINLVTASPFIRTQVPDLSSSNHDQYYHRPIQWAAYIQDKLEFNDLIVNIGVRYDYFDPDGVVLNDPTDPNIYLPIKPSNRFFDYNGNGTQDPGEPDKTVADRRGYWYRKASTKASISPRVGVSFPITAEGIVHFSYGHFFQIPRFEDLYYKPEFKIGQGTGNQGSVGNPDLRPQETINGELGLQQQLTEDISVDVSVFLRDIRNLTGTQNSDIVVFGGATTYSQYTNSDFGLAKGITLTVNKRFSGGLSAQINYTYLSAQGTASDPQAAQKALAGGSLPEVQLNPLDWDQTHTLNADVTYSTSGWGASTIIQFGSGRPYTPKRTTDITALLTNSQSKPSTFDVDLRAFYEFTLSAFKVVAFARVFNVFDIRNVVDVYTDTGLAGITEDETLAAKTNPAQRVNSLDQWFHIPTQYSEPRRIEIGLQMEF